jgi:hypothetical protein
MKNNLIDRDPVFWTAFEHLEQQIIKQIYLRLRHSCTSSLEDGVRRAAAVNFTGAHRE